MTQTVQLIQSRDSGANDDSVELLDLLVRPRVDGQRLLERVRHLTSSVRSVSRNTTGRLRPDSTATVQSSLTSQHRGTIVEWEDMAN